MVRTIFGGSGKARTEPTANPRMSLRRLRERRGGLGVGGLRGRLALRVGHDAERLPILVFRHRHRGLDLALAVTAVVVVATRASDMARVELHGVRELLLPVGAEFLVGQHALGLLGEREVLVGHDTEARAVERVDRPELRRAAGCLGRLGRFGFRLRRGRRGDRFLADDDGRLLLVDLHLRPMGLDGLGGGGSGGVRGGRSSDLLGRLHWSLPFRVLWFDVPLTIIGAR
jgi:hypothetical protein